MDPPRPRSRLKNKNVIFEKLFFYTALFFGVFRQDFFSKLPRSETDKTYRFLAIFLILMNSHEKTKHSVEQAIISSRQYAGPNYFVQAVWGKNKNQQPFGRNPYSWATSGHESVGGR